MPDPDSLASIDTLSIDIMRGQPKKLAVRTETWIIPGVPGYGAQTLADGDAEFDLTTVCYFDTPSHADTFIDNCRALQGYIKTVVTNFGQSFPDVLIMAVNTDNAKKACVWNGNANAIRCELQWKMITVKPPS